MFHSKTDRIDAIWYKIVYHLVIGVWDFIDFWEGFQTYQKQFLWVSFVGIYTDSELKVFLDSLFEWVKVFWYYSELWNWYKLRLYCCILSSCLQPIAFSDESWMKIQDNFEIILSFLKPFLQVEPYKSVIIS